MLTSPSEEAKTKLVLPSAGIMPEGPLQTLLDYAARIAEERRVTRLLELIRDMGKAVVCANRCSVWVLDWEYDELYTVASDGIDQVRIASNNGLVGMAITESQAIFITDAYSDPRFDPELDKKAGYRTQSVMVLPFWDGGGEPLGCFQVINKLTPGGCSRSRICVSWGWWHPMGAKPWNPRC